LSEGVDYEQQRKPTCAFSGTGFSLWVWISDENDLTTQDDSLCTPKRPPNLLTQIFNHPVTDNQKRWQSKNL